MPGQRDAVLALVEIKQSDGHRFRVCLPECAESDKNSNIYEAVQNTLEHGALKMSLNLAPNSFVLTTLGSLHLYPTLAALQQCCCWRICRRCCRAALDIWGV